ncbi:MAG: PQQ-dependent sugar dehydrogenase [Myxococcales bacterium]|nr:PQQ-dependent sugar dehydrogenase [Myxococcales bacterium]
MRPWYLGCAVAITFSACVTTELESPDSKTATTQVDSYVDTSNPAIDVGNSDTNVVFTDTGLSDTPAGIQDIVIYDVIDAGNQDATQSDVFDSADIGCDSEDCVSECSMTVAGYREELLVGDLAPYKLVDIAFAPDGRVFVALKNGEIRIVQNGQLLPVPFVTVPQNSEAWEENGLLDIEIDPEFGQSPYLYVFQSYIYNGDTVGKAGTCDTLSCPFELLKNPDGTTEVQNPKSGPTPFGNTRQRIIRYNAAMNTAISPNAFESLLTDLPGGTQTHNGGGLAFGNDQRLFVGLGDATTPPNAQDFSNIVGCILRIDKNTGAAPPDNPFVSPNDGIPDRIYACGIRQGFGLAVHPDTGELYQSENGPSYGDELNWIPKGGNLGWPLGSGFLNNGTTTDPVQSWTPTIAPAKLLIYKGSLLPDLYGDVLIASWNQGDIRRIRLANPQQLPQKLGWESDFLPYVGKPVLVGQDDNGVIYYGEFLTGKLYRVLGVNQCDAPVPVIQTLPDNLTGIAPFAVQFDASASLVRPPATQLVKAFWEFGADEGHLEGMQASHTFTHIGNHVATVTIVDSVGRHAQQLFTVSVMPNAGDQIPSTHITTTQPQSGSAPLEVYLRGHAHDGEGPLSELRWNFGDNTPDTVFVNQPPNQDVELFHLYKDPGVYVLTLSTKDNAGQSGQSTVKITVEKP